MAEPVSKVDGHDRVRSNGWKFAKPGPTSLEAPCANVDSNTLGQGESVSGTYVAVGRRLLVAPSRGVLLLVLSVLVRRGRLMRLSREGRRVRQ